MTVLILTNCPAGLRGFLTRWLQEIAPGVFIGTPSARLRDVIWDEVRQYAHQGRALLAYQTDTEQGYTFATHDHAWHPVDHEGLTLIHRPRPGGPSRSASASSASSPSSLPATGWSKAAKRRRFGGGSR